MDGTSLKLLLDIVQGAFNARNELFPTKTSSEKAKIATIRLYQRLKSLERLTDELVERMQLWNYVATSNTTDKELKDDATDDLSTSALKFGYELENLNTLLSTYGVQLEIYVPTLREEIDTFIATRGGITDWTSQIAVRFLSDAQALSTKDKAQLKGVLLKADENRARIHGIVKEFREFIIQNFDYKEAF